MLQIDPNTKTLKLKLVQNLLEKFPEHSVKIRSIVNRSYISSILENNRRIEQKQSLSDQFLYYFNKLQEDSFDSPFAKDAIVFFPPQILPESQNLKSNYSSIQTRSKSPIENKIIMTASVNDSTNPVNSENVNDQDSLHCPDEEEEEEDPTNFEDYEEVDDWETHLDLLLDSYFMGKSNISVQVLVSTPSTFS